MITEAYISGAINKAVFKQNDEYFIIQKSDKEVYISSPFNQFDWNSFVLVKPEIESYLDIKWGIEKLQEELEKYSEMFDALNLFLTGMDTSFSDELRIESMQQLLESLANSETETFVKNRVFSSVVPEEFNPLSASQLSKKIGNDKLNIWYLNIHKAKNIISIVRNAWLKNIADSGIEVSKRDILEKVFTDKGILADFVLAFLNDHDSLGSVILNHSDTVTKSGIGNAALFLMKIKNLVDENLDIIEHKHSDEEFQKLADEDTEHIEVKDDFVYVFSTLIDNFTGKSKRKQKKYKHLKIGRKKFTGGAGGTVKDRIGWIKDNIIQGHIDEAKDAILQLIEFQDENSDAEHLCKSLCYIAKDLLERNMVKESNLLAEKAINLNPNDIVPYTIIADNLRIMKKYKLSLLKYEEIDMNFVSDIVAICGKAETLRQMGRLNEALKTYNKAIDDFPNDVVSLSGKAETLRQMGRLDEALETYNKAIDDFPNEVVPPNGKAETLRQMGRLDEALETYNKAINDFQNDVVPLSGKSETLRQMGRLDEALVTYNKATNNFPNDVVALSGKAETLRQMGRLDEALETYNKAIDDFPNEVVPPNGKAETLRQMGRLDEALKTYNNAINDFPNDVVPLSGKAETLRQMGRLDEALETYNKAINDFPNDVVALNGKAETLRQMGRLNEALDTYNNAINDFPNEVVSLSGKAETLRQMGKLTEAISIYDETIEKFPYAQYPKRGRFVILIQNGNNLDEIEKQTNINNPQSSDDWILSHIHCMLLIKQNKIDEAINKLKYGVNNIKDIANLKYYKSALSYAYIKRKKYKEAAEELENEKEPVFEVLKTHVYAEKGDIIVSKQHFKSIYNSEVKQINSAAKYLSDRYKLNGERFYPGVSMTELDNKILEVEFDLITSSYSYAA